MFFQKFFRVPVSPEQAKLKFARVNHNKYMVTDRAAWIGSYKFNSFLRNEIFKELLIGLEIICGFTFFDYN